MTRETDAHRLPMSNLHSRYAELENFLQLVCHMKYTVKCSHMLFLLLPFIVKHNASELSVFLSSADIF